MRVNFLKKKPSHDDPRLQKEIERLEEDPEFQKLLKSRRNIKILSVLIEHVVPVTAIFLLFISFFIFQDNEFFVNSLVLALSPIIIYYVYSIFNSALDSDEIKRPRVKYPFIADWISEMNDNDDPISSYVSHTEFREKKKDKYKGNHINSIDVSGNLHFIRDSIIEYCYEWNQGDNTLRMMRAYYGNLTTNNKKPIVQTVLGLFLVLSVFALQGIISGDYIPIVLNIEISGFTLIISTLYVIVTVMKDTLRKQRRFTLIYNIINELIEENNKKEQTDGKSI
ncbi:hypothetical protein HUG20_08420 [Salicibibacter cibi]|uniref:Uncharacterized protein n=1 Tax=Salicibibacter cibi TaxID=2743001 RepID=A0A7T6ZAJ1_9BACI|nr:hypothetical protein [Salicibibacter cibi]QQK79905.1 hypothetical protein HUG20_08420 [Salicibibacter cibi]